MPQYSFDLERIRTIASTCRASGEQINTEASTLRTQIANLHEAMQGVPNIGVAEDFDGLNRLLTQVSDALSQSDSFLQQVVNKVEEFVTSLGQR